MHAPRMGGKKTGVCREKHGWTAGRRAGVGGPLITRGVKTAKSAVGGLFGGGGSCKGSNIDSIKPGWPELFKSGVSFSNPGTTDRQEAMRKHAKK